MAIVLASKPGLSSTTTLHIPKDWDPTWFRNFISNQLKGADVRNAIGANGISITGTIASPYATIGLTAPIILKPGPGLDAIDITPSASGNAIGISLGTATGFNALVAANSAGKFVMDILANGNFEMGTVGATQLSFYTNNDTRVAISSAGNVTIAAPSSGSGLTVNGDILTTGGIQVTGYSTVGFAGPGIEFGLTSGTGYLQAYNRTGAAYLPMQITGSSVAINIGGVTSTSFIISTNATYATLTNSSAGYSSAYGGVAGLQIDNTSSTMQSVLDFGLNGVLAGRLRCDYAGNLSHVATAAGVHNFFIGGDSGTGGIAGLVNATGFATTIATYLMQSTVTQANGAGAGAGTLTNAPAAGNPTKWFAVNDNGTVRHIPAW
jgi:hypothetical protein